MSTNSNDVSKQLPDAINRGRGSYFTQMPNEILRSTELSGNAKAVLGILLSNSNGWKSHRSAIQSMMREGKEAVGNALKQLKQCGYLKHVQYRDKQTKQFRGTFWVYGDYPHDFRLDERIEWLEDMGLEIQPESDDNAREREIRGPENPEPGKPGPKNNNNKNNNNKRNGNKLPLQDTASQCPDFESNKNARTPEKDGTSPRSKTQTHRIARRKAHRPEPKQHPLLTEWNQYPQVTHHSGVKVTARIRSMLRKLEDGSFFETHKLDKDWCKRYNIRPVEVKRPWPQEALSTALENLARMFRDDYEPADTKNYPRDLPTLIYNPYSQKSLLLKAYYNPPRQLKTAKTEEQEQRMDKATHSILEQLRTAMPPDVKRKADNKLKEVAAALADIWHRHRKQLPHLYQIRHCRDLAHYYAEAFEIAYESWNDRPPSAVNGPKVWQVYRNTYFPEILGDDEKGE